MKPLTSATLCRFAATLAALVCVATFVLAGSVQAAYPLLSGDLGISSGDGSPEGDEGEVNPGQTMNLSGGGFAPGSSVSIFFRSDPVLLAITEADSTGAIDASVTIPENAPPGTHTLEARGAAAGGETLVLTRSVEVLGAEQSARSESGLPLLTLALAVAGVAGIAVAFLIVGRRASGHRS